MKKPLNVVIVFSLLLFSLSGCFGVVPSAWVSLKMEGGYTTYTTDMYGNDRDHIYYYQSQEDAKDIENWVIAVNFIPRILGPEEVELDGKKVKTTIVDISTKADMNIYIKPTSSVYSGEKSIYLNGEKLTPSDTVISEYLCCYYFQDVELERGNPGGKINGKVNIIEYR